MNQRNRLLVIAHSIAMPIDPDEIEHALAPEDVVSGWDLVEIVPERIAIADFHTINWADLQAKQDQQIVERLLPAITNRRRIAYFGFGPLPAAIHLGRRLYGYKVDVYQRNHETHEWAWSTAENITPEPVMNPIVPVEFGSSNVGDVVLRVSITHRIAPTATKNVVKDPLAEMDVVVKKPGNDGLPSKNAFDEAVTSVEEALHELHRHFPNARALHLFIAGPLGLAFQIGAKLNPTIFPTIHTYQYHAASSPQYLPAIVLGGQTEAERMVFSARDASEARIAQPKPLVWANKELITGKQPSFLEIAFLHKGIEAARSVVHIKVWNHDFKPFHGTGFLIAPETILTNHHVLFNEGKPVRRALIWFNYERDMQGNQCQVDHCEGDVSTIVGDLDHDWAIIRFATSPRESYEPLRLGANKPVLPDDFVYIVQHPQGEPKKIGMTHNQVVAVTDDCIQYLTDTLPGSSGAPVFNESWRVIALHREGLEDRTDEKHPFKNQGTHINRVLEGLKAAKILDPPK